MPLSEDDILKRKELKAFLQETETIKFNLIAEIKLCDDLAKCKLILDEFLQNFKLRTQALKSEIQRLKIK